MKRIMNYLTTAHSRLLCNQQGASMVEYALVVAAVAAAAAAILGASNAAGDGGTGLMGKIVKKVSDIIL